MTEHYIKTELFILIKKEQILNVGDRNLLEFVAKIKDVESIINMSELERYFHCIDAYDKFNTLRASTKPRRRRINAFYIPVPLKVGGED